MTKTLRLGGRLLLLLAAATILVAAQHTVQDPYHKKNADEDDRLVQETIEAGRGHRDEKGERDQWGSTEHLKARFDSRRPISTKVKALMDRYQIDCKDCDHAEAVAKVNAFLKDAKEEDARRERRQLWWSRALNALTILVLVCAAVAFTHKEELQAMIDAKLDEKYGGADSTPLSEARRQEIEKQRQNAALAAEARAKEAAEKEAPNWREREEKEVWTSKQEKQFTKALASFGGVPAKARYTLIADKVEGKTRNECLMHHKLLQAREKEAEGKED